MARIAALSAGDPLQVRAGANRWELLDGNGTVVGQLAGGFKAPPDMRCTDATVLAIATWGRERSEPQYQSPLRCDTWEVVVPELVFEPIRNLNYTGPPTTPPPPSQQQHTLVPQQPLFAPQAAAVSGPAWDAPHCLRGCCR